MNNIQYQYNCCGCTEQQQAELEELMDTAKNIKYETFSRNIGSKNMAFLNDLFGYKSIPKKVLTMKKDYAVNYLSAKIGQKRAYILRHSAIEYVFYAETKQTQH